MNYQEQALEMLQAYGRMRMAERNLRTQLAMRLEDRERQALELALKRTVSWLRMVDGALDTLDREERTILQRLYCKKRSGGVGQLCQQLEVEKSSIYRRRNKALRHFAQAIYGPLAEE